MSALSAIEAPVAAAPHDGSAAGPQIGGRERPLRGVPGAVSWILVQVGEGAAGDTQPRSSSIPGTADGRPRIDLRVAGAASATPVRADARVLRTPLQGARTTDAGVPRAPLRLTRRGRIVVAVLVMAGVTLAALLITLLAPGGAQATNHGPARAGYQGMHQIVVRPGQTLWSIAAGAEPTADPRTVIQEIMSANALGSAAVSAGQLLWVP